MPVLYTPINQEQRIFIIYNSAAREKAKYFSITIKNDWNESHSTTWSH